MTADVAAQADRRGRNGLRGPIKESRRLRITISHKKRTRLRLEEALARLDGELVDLNKQLELVVKAETAVSA